MEESVKGRRGARISDLFIVTAVVAAFAMHAMLGFTALSLTLFAVWNRPDYFRFWVCGMAGFSTGVLLSGIYDLQFFAMLRGETITWGGGLLAGTLVSLVVFLWPLQAMPEDRRVQ